MRTYAGVLRTDRPVFNMENVMAKKSVFAASPDGRLFVEAAAIMTPLVAVIDGLPVAFFGKSKKAYLEVDMAIEWCQKEKSFHSADKYATLIAVLERAKKQNEKELSSQGAP